MECWWAQPSSHDGSVNVHSRARSINGPLVMGVNVHSRARSINGPLVMAARWDFADLQKSTRRDSKEQSHLPECSYCAGSVLYT